MRKKRKAFLAKWRLRCRGVADSMEEAGERLFTFLRYPPQQWKSLRTTNAIERLHGEFKRRVKTQCALPNAETAAMLFWALMASGQITMRRVGGWQRATIVIGSYAKNQFPPTIGHDPSDGQVHRSQMSVVGPGCAKTIF